ncbi:DNA polymerase [Synechococcus phage S-MbCM6]|jgi:DNA polymerase elongation subunit (family B)|uniref:DNA-directed DNA polymerase n=3 Tax=Namakavirus smbcm6 TaxID=2734120 RepID=V5UUH1_9CAUD|nr:DNA polymerase [Synechococcus phage S-MbCM25]AIX14550.1 DNA polymerase [Synechococcus phage ACG-2014c]AIX22707.1 DNA polymerase [Synechococcus phage ACG-2014c]AIX22922.1 DNA polymerase [Synechococcus phage ACG-2014c]AIX38154.1 DNA polymerase [Synechococcus phage ACG-2014c]
MSSFYTNIQLAGNTILYRGYENGKQIQSRTHFSPTLFVTSQKEEKNKTLEGENVKPIKFESPREARNFIGKYEGIDNFNVYGYERYVYQFIAEEFPGEVDYDMKQMKIFSMDIEVQCENGFPNVEEAAEEMLCITVKDMNTKEIFVWGTREFTPPEGVKFFVFWTEHEMLNNFVRWWAENTPDILTGWNVNLYDVPYICRRVNRVLGEKWMKSLSPWNRANEREITIMGRTQIAYDLSGINILDYMDLYKKFTYTNQESYRLDHIAFVELGQRKLDHSEYENFKDFYTSDWQKFVEYNIQDVELIDRLEDKMKLIELAVTMAYDAKVNLEDVYSQVRMWDTMIYNYLKDRNVVVPPRKTAKKDEKYAGAYVKEPTPGLYDWVVSFDLNSLYPHLIMQYNISPETLVESRHPSATVDKILGQTLDIKGDYCVCANGAQYRKDILGFLPEMMQKIYDERTIYKKRMLKSKQALEHATTSTETTSLQKDISKFNNIQMARKIQLNSAYGAIGNQYFRYYNLANAEAITMSGQVSIRWIEKKINGYLNKILQTEEEDYVIASDTDSIYLNLGPLVNKFFAAKSSNKAAVVGILDKICQEKLEPFIESAYQELADYVAAYDQKMKMKRENIADKGIWTAKKRYILNVWDSEGVRYEKPKLKMMGIEAVKSSTPAPCRQKIKDALIVIMNEDEESAQKFIADFREEFLSLPVEDISFPRGCNNLNKWSNPATVYTKGTPIHVRGALLYNFYIKKGKLTHKYPLIQDGEKIKFVYLKTPNKINENVISFFQTFPKEFGIDKQVDYDLQFGKSFLDPLRVIMDAIGWKPEKVASLEFLFG